MTVKWEPKARERLKEIIEYLHQRDPDYAFAWINRIYNATDQLETFPEMGRIIPELENPRLRELIFEGRYRVMYRLTSDEIQILTVRDGRQHFDSTTLFEP